MSSINGVLVRLKTASSKNASTDDQVYLGIVGTMGGREFALDSKKNDFEADSNVGYRFGPSVATYQNSDWDDTRDPRTAALALDDMTIGLENVTYVYIRKQGSRSRTGDDEWRLELAQVWLFAHHGHPGDDPPNRLFETTGPATFANEYGHQVWLAENNSEPPLLGVTTKFEVSDVLIDLP